MQTSRKLVFAFFMVSFLATSAIASLHSERDIATQKPLIQTEEKEKQADVNTDATSTKSKHFETTYHFEGKSGL